MITYVMMVLGWLCLFKLMYDKGLSAAMDAATKTAKQEIRKAGNSERLLAGSRRDPGGGVTAECSTL